MGEDFGELSPARIATPSVADVVSGVFPYLNQQNIVFLAKGAMDCADLFCRDVCAQVVLSQLRTGFCLILPLPI
jgi:hypothetical protein